MIATVFVLSVIILLHIIKDINTADGQCFVDISPKAIVSKSVASVGESNIENMTINCKEKWGENY